MGIVIYALRVNLDAATLPLLTLNDGNSIPAIGLGTFGMRGDDGVAAVAAGIRGGNHLLDTAHKYENEPEVREGVRTCGFARDESSVTTKLRGRHHGHDETFVGFGEYLGNLGFDYVDLFIIQWPLPSVDRLVDSWRVMIEMHPHFSQVAMRTLHDRLGIVTESWGPLATQKSLITNPVVTAIAGANHESPTRVVLRWHVQLGFVPIPKSADPHRQRENLEVFDFELSADDMAAISALESGRLWGGDPKTHKEF